MLFSFMMFFFFFSLISFSNFWFYFYSFFFLILFFFYFMSTSETMFNNHFSILSLDSLNSYLVLLHFLIMIMSYMSMKKIFQKDLKLGILITLSITISGIFLFTSISMFIFLMVFESLVVLIFYYLFYFSDYKERMFSFFYMFFMTLIFSIPLLILVVYSNIMSYDIYSFLMLMSSKVNMLFIYFLMLTFFMKLPVYSFHIWLPKAHVDAPVGGSMILASVMLKFSSYSLMRLIILFFVKVNLFFIFLSGYSFFFMSFMCTRLLDLKVLIAMSSVNHMSFAMLSNINNLNLSFKSSFFMYLSHGFTSPLMFFLAYMMVFFLGTRNLIFLKSISHSKSLLYLFFFIVMINMSIPPFINFFSELYIISSLFFYFKIIIFFLIISFILNSFFHIFLITKLASVKNFFLKKKMNFSMVFLMIFLIIFYFLFSFLKNFII